MCDDALEAGSRSRGPADLERDFNRAGVIVTSDDMEGVITGSEAFEGRPVYPFGGWGTPAGSAEERLIVSVSSSEVPLATIAGSRAVTMVEAAAPPTLNRSLPSSS